MNFILCGLPMTGKSTIGKLLAEKLKYNFYDTDQLVEDVFSFDTGRHLTCREIFIEDGEDQFRKLEKEQIATLRGIEESIIVVGGGALSDAENVSSLKNLGRIIYLIVSPEKIWERICSRGMPAYLDHANPEKDFYELAKKRLPDYKNTADETVDINNLSEKDVVALLLKRFNYGKQ